MRLTYETGTGTLIQFIALGLLNIVTGLNSVITICTHNSSSCVSNMLASIFYYFLVIGWFAIILTLGITAQNSRSRRLAQLLILAELAVFCVAAFNIHLDLAYHNGLIDVLTSLVDIFFSLWIISLAYRLIKTRGKRVIRRPRRGRNLS